MSATFGTVYINRAPSSISLLPGANQKVVVGSPALSTGQVGLTGPAGATNNDTVRGLAAMKLLTSSLMGRKAVIADFVNGGYFATDESTGPVFSTVENIPSLTFTNSGGRSNGRKMKPSTFAPNSFRYHYLQGGTPAGILIDPAFTYLNKKTNPAVADLETGTNVSNGAAPSGWGTNAIVFGDNSVSRFSGFFIPTTTGQLYFGSFLIVMDDGSVPAPGTAIAQSGSDFSLYGPGGASPINPDTGLNGSRVTGPFASNVYLVESYWTSLTTDPGAPVGIDKRAANTVKGFKVLHYQIGAGRYPPSLFDNATSTPNTRNADVIRIPLSGYTFDQITLFGEFVVPSGNNNNYVLQLFNNATSRLQTFITFNVFSMNFYDGVSQYGPSVSNLVPGTKYKFACAIDGAQKKVRGKVQGFVTTGESSFPTTFSGGPSSLVVGSYDASTNFLGSSLSIAGVVDRAWSAAEIAGWVG